VWFAESLEKLGDNLREVRPHAFLGVPRVWEKIQAKVVAVGASNPPLKKKISEKGTSLPPQRQRQLRKRLKRLQRARRTATALEARAKKPAKEAAAEAAPAAPQA